MTNTEAESFADDNQIDFKKIYIHLENLKKEYSKKKPEEKKESEQEFQTYE